MHKHIRYTQKCRPHAKVLTARDIIDYAQQIVQILCMHKSVVHAQECCACTRTLCMHNNLSYKNKPLLLGRCAASGVFFQEKKDQQHKNAYLSEQITFMCFSKKTDEV